MMTMFCVFRNLEATARTAAGKRVQSMVVAQQGKPFFRTERFRMHLSSRESAVFKKFVLAPGTTALKPDKPVFAPSVSRTYQAIRAGGEPGLPGDIVRRLAYLNRLGDWAPAAMLALKDWRRDPDRAALLIDRMAHLMRLCAGNGKRVRRFSDIIAAIRSGDAIDETHPVFQLTREETRSIVFHLKDLHKRGPKISKLLRLGDAIGGRFHDERQGAQRRLPSQKSDLLGQHS
jgi:hypothetical protein